MTNTETKLIAHVTRIGRDTVMHSSIDERSAIVHDRIRERGVEASGERLAGELPGRTSAAGIRTLVGGALIRAGRAIAPELGPRGHARHWPTAGA